MRTIVKYLDKILAFFAVIFFLAFIGTVVIQIFSRTFLPKTPSWTEELSRYFFIYAIASAAGLAVRTNSFVAVDIFTSKIPKQLQRPYQIAIDFLLMAFVLFIEVKCVFKFAFLKVRMVSTALQMPMQYVYFSMVLLFGLLALCYLFEIILLIQNKPMEEGAL